MWKNGYNYNHSKKVLKDTVLVRGRGSATGGSTWQQTAHVVTLKFKPRYPNVMWNMFSPGYQHLSSVLKCTVPRGSYYHQTSCWNMLKQLRGENWQVLSISTQPDGLPVVSSEYNPFISRCPQISPLKACKMLSMGWSIWWTWNWKVNIVLLVRFSLWHGSLSMCKSSS